MCQYSAHDGVPTDWHLVHLGTRAVGGAGVVITEAAAVSPEGRITPADAGIWNEAQRAAWARIVTFIKAQGAIAGVQLAHAGRKASMKPPWQDGARSEEADGGWQPVGPSDERFHDTYWQPRELSRLEIQKLVDEFADAARRAMLAGFDVVEVHAAHGYLLHQFLSPLVNHRRDGYGGSLDARLKFPMDVCAAVRDAFPKELPVWVRVSATDWKAGGWDVAQTVEFAKRLKQIDIDMVGCSSGGAVHGVSIPVGPGYQVPLAAQVRREAEMATYAVGLITNAAQAEQVLMSGAADALALARLLLRDPYWPRRAAQELGDMAAWPDPYKRGAVGPMGV